MSRSMNQFDSRVCLTRGDHVLLTGPRNPRKNKIRSNETVRREVGDVIFSANGPSS